MILQHLSIRYKLLVLLACSAALALFISSCLIILYTQKTQYTHSLNDLEQYTNVMSTNIQASVLFRDEISAKKMLSSFENNSHIMSAWVVDEEGKILSHFNSQTHKAKEVDTLNTELESLLISQQKNLFEKQQRYHYTSEHAMAILQPIVYEGSTIGVLVIANDTAQFEMMMYDFMTIQFSISLATLAIIFMLSWWFQKPFITPVISLIETFQNIAKTKNYATSVSVTQKDEFGTLYKHFNSMLAQIKERDERLLHLASTDSLTGLSNRYYAMEMMHTLVAKALRHQGFISVIMLDIDHFKAINDTYGHMAGDEVLRVIAKLIIESAREYDLVARVGGEEFLIVCEGCDDHALSIIAERIRSTVEAKEIHYETSLIHVTISVGGYVHIPSSHNIEPLLKIADDALYEAKMQGRNCVVVKGSACA
jgi:diguanylate cyclase (GGDEF)-like protein